MTFFLVKWICGMMNPMNDLTHLSMFYRIGGMGRAIAELEGMYGN